MSKTSHINEIMQNLNTLSLAELLLLRAKVDGLIEEKSSPLSPQVLVFDSHKDVIYVNREHGYTYLATGLDSLSNQDNSLEKVINLVDEWMADESDYDEETYSSIEPALNRNQPPL